MQEPVASDLAEEHLLALAHTPASLRAMLAASFALDRRLGQIVARTTEPVLGQMRLAWWREMLGREVQERPSGDAVLDAVSRHWRGSESALLTLVDAWELFLIEQALAPASLVQFANGRSAPFQALLQSERSSGQVHVAPAGWLWTLGDAATRVSRKEERAAIVDVALSRAGVRRRLPRELYGLAMLDALALRSLRRGGRPLMEGRGAALVALRAGLLGR